MSFEECRCLTPLCDGCETDCWDGQDSPPHFSLINIRVAREMLVEKHGWEITERADGTFLMLCGPCARRRECERDRHQWYVPGLNATVPATGRPVELCSRCGIVRRDYEPLEAPPADHPESLTELSDADKALFDAFEAEFTEARKEN